MATVTFDTLKFVEKLRAAGVSEAQAKAQAEVLVFAMADVMDQQLATKADILRLERETKTDIAGLDRSVKAEFKEVRADIARLERDLFLIKWMMGILIAGVMAIALKSYFPG